MFFIYLLLGTIASFLSGLLGIGGGLVIVPSLLAIFAHFDVIQAPYLLPSVIATSLAASLVNLIFAVQAHQGRSSIVWSFVWRMLPGIALGSLILGPLLLHVLSPAFIKGVFSGFCFFMAAQWFFKRSSPKTRARERLSYPMACLWGAIIGMLSSMLGIGGAVLVTLVLSFYALDMRQVVGTGAACALFIAAFGCIGLWLSAIIQTHAVSVGSGYIYWPALLGLVLPSIPLSRLGAHLAHELSARNLQRFYAFFVLVIAFMMLHAAMLKG